MLAKTKTKNEWGFTDDRADLDAMIAWREAAVADGWRHQPTYPSHEGEDRACTLDRDGFRAMILTRCPTSLDPRNAGRWLAEAKVSLWGPDGLAIKPPDAYDWTRIKVGAETCNYCGAVGVQTERVAFAGRACAECGPKERAKLPRNWAD